MARRVVWYLARSPLASLLSALPEDLESAPVPARGLPSPGDGEGSVLVIDVTAGDSIDEARAATRGTDVPLVALVDAAAVPDTLPALCYACLTKPITPIILASALTNDGAHARLVSEAAATDEQLG